MQISVVILSLVMGAPPPPAAPSVIVREVPPPQEMAAIGAIAGKDLRVLHYCGENGRANSYRTLWSERMASKYGAYGAVMVWAMDDAAAQGVDTAKPPAGLSCSDYTKKFDGLLAVMKER